MCHNFYPRSPCGERLLRLIHHQSMCRFLSTLSLRRATNPVFAVTSEVSISIHALLAESDKLVWFGIIDILNFYPRSPCGERLRQNPGKHYVAFRFLSTLSLRRATSANCSCHSVRPDFYPRSPCGERHSASGTLSDTSDISIHALLAESDNDCEQYYIRARISIHALLAESDRIHRQFPRQTRISIHALLAESDAGVMLGGLWVLSFLSTLSLRRATWPGLLARPFFLISIHALLAESDCFFCVKLQLRLIFLSTLSLRRATVLGIQHKVGEFISIHALLAESDAAGRFAVILII